jgi:hypothetical protein
VKECIGMSTEKKKTLHDKEREIVRPDDPRRTKPRAVASFRAKHPDVDDRSVPDRDREMMETRSIRNTDFEKNRPEIVKDEPGALVSPSQARELLVKKLLVEGRATDNEDPSLTRESMASLAGKLEGRTREEKKEVNKIKKAFLSAEEETPREEPDGKDG